MNTWKWLRNIILACFLLVLLPYLLLVLPEYAACYNTMYEGEQARVIWGYTLDCYGESKDIGKSFFQMLSGLLLILALLGLLLHLLVRHKKKQG